MVTRQEIAWKKQNQRFVTALLGKKKKKKSVKSHRALSSSRAKFYQSSRTISRWVRGLKA